MKFQKLILTLVVASFVLIGCKNDTKSEKNNPQNQEIVTTDSKELAINISGMTCEIGCAKVIESKLAKQNGVLDAKVIFNDSIATIKYDGSKTNKASIISFVNGIANNMYKASETKACLAKKSCDASCTKTCDKNKDTKACSSDCKKDCCKSAEIKPCSVNCTKACCAQKKACKADCQKECCTIVAV